VIQSRHLKSRDASLRTTLLLENGKWSGAVKRPPLSAVVKKSVQTNQCCRLDRKKGEERDGTRQKAVVGENFDLSKEMNKVPITRKKRSKSSVDQRKVEVVNRREAKKKIGAALEKKSRVGERGGGERKNAIRLTKPEVVESGGSANLQTSRGTEANTRRRPKGDARRREAGARTRSEKGVAPDGRRRRKQGTGKRSRSATRVQGGKKAEDNSFKRRPREKDERDRGKKSRVSKT